MFFIYPIKLYICKCQLKFKINDKNIVPINIWHAYLLTSTSIVLSSAFIINFMLPWDALIGLHKGDHRFIIKYLITKWGGFFCFCEIGFYVNI